MQKCFGYFFYAFNDFTMRNNMNEQRITGSNISKKIHLKSRFQKKDL